jgi:hypothetical protein
MREIDKIRLLTYYSGSCNNLVFQKNGRIRTKKKKVRIRKKKG